MEHTDISAEQNRGPDTKREMRQVAGMYMYNQPGQRETQRGEDGPAFKPE
jgi:hypothetical protein